MLGLLLVGWYVYLSAIDWSIHKYILHSKYNTAIRKTHRMHHYAHDSGSGLGLDLDLDTGLTFSVTEGLSIGIISMLPLLGASLGLGLGWNSSLIIIHICFVLVGVGMHNYAHTRCHDGQETGSSFKIPIPDAVCKILHRHHKKHHLYPKTRYCTIYLGFDYLMGTYDSIKPLDPASCEKL